MRNFKNIIESNNEPDTNSVWLKEDKLHVYTKGQWQPITGNVKKKDSEYDKFGYIKDGLVIHFDGIERGDNPNEWVNIIDGERCVPKGTDVEFGPDYVFGPLYGSCVYHLPYFKCTVEVVVERLRHVYDQFFTVGTNNSVCAGFTSNRILFTQGPNNRQLVCVNNVFSVNENIFRISCNRDRAIVNEQTQNVSHEDYWILRDTTLRVGSVSLVSKIYSIRVYNRILSEEEMLHNQKIDRIRFNISDSTDTMTLDLDGEVQEELDGKGQVDGNPVNIR